jgi:hypothetical protein
MTLHASSYALLAALVLGAFGVGGGLYETILIDRAWPRLPAIIQPRNGGIDRKRFWGPAHGVFELSLVIALWLCWSDAAARPWVIGALVVHLAQRAWAFAYFIPRAVGFEKADTVPEDAAVKWTRLSRWRILCGVAALAMLVEAMAALGP